MTRLVESLFAAPSARPARRPRLGCEALEVREVPAVLFQLTDGGRRLEITGTAEADDVTVTNPFAGAYEVHTPGMMRKVYAPAVEVIAFTGGGGGDRFENDTATRAWADGGAGNDTLLGGTGADTLLGGNFHDALFGAGGDDLLSGGDGYDSVMGAAGNDTLYGGDMSDTLRGGSGNDALFDGLGLDLVTGGSGTNTFTSGMGPDTLIGGSPNDVFAGDLGGDQVKKVELKGYAPPAQDPDDIPGYPLQNKGVFDPV